MDRPLISAMVAYGLALVLIVVVLARTWPVRAHEAPSGGGYVQTMGL